MPQAALSNKTPSLLKVYYLMVALQLGCSFINELNTIDNFHFLHLPLLLAEPTLFYIFYLIIFIGTFFRHEVTLFFALCAAFIGVIGGLWMFLKILLVSVMHGVNWDNVFMGNGGQLGISAACLYILTRKDVRAFFGTGKAALHA